MYKYIQGGPKNRKLGGGLEDLEQIYKGQGYS